MQIVFKDPASGEDFLNLDLLPSQELFWKAEDRYILFSGGLGCGKSLIMLLKVIFECMQQDNNYFLVGRSTYGEIHDVLIKEFFELCHDSWIKEYRKTPHPTVILHTFSGKTSEIIFRNLDKMSKGELLGLNLGGFAIDQAEDIPEEVFQTLKGRLRRKSINHRVFMTSNPKLSWLYRAFKQHPQDNYRLIEASTLENEKNLPKEYVEDLKKYPKTWFNQYVLGVWDESLLADNIVFAREYIEQLNRRVRDPKREYEGLKIFKEFDPTHTYQIGIDAAEGADTTEDTLRQSPKDSGVIYIWDHTNDEEAASFSAKITPRALAHKAVTFAHLYGDPLMVPEMNSMGLALLDTLENLGYDNVYRRQEFDRVLKKSMKKLGWRTTSASKMLLIAHFEDLLRLREPKVYSRETVEELKTFVYTDAAKKKGAGAQEGFHDDRVMAMLLAAFSHQPVIAGKVSNSTTHGTLEQVDTVPSVTVVNGKVRPPQSLRREAHWTVW